MKKRIYQTKNVKHLNWELIKKEVTGRSSGLFLDVAKIDQFAELSTDDGSFKKLFKWKHPHQTPLVLQMLHELECKLVVVMESTSTYGDSLRAQFRRFGFAVHQVNTKRVHDAKELFDGVPSLHDAKAATIIGQLYRNGLTQPWVELNDDERKLNALRLEFELHQEQYFRNINRLEAYLNRHWPEIGHLFNLQTVTLEQLIKRYGCPKSIAADAIEAGKLMREIGGYFLSQEKIDETIESARTTIGVDCIPAEKSFLQALATELEHSRTKKHKAQQALESFIEKDNELDELSKLIGKVTTAILISLRLDPRRYVCSQAYVKALGLNLKEKSSGKHIGQLKLTKRGSSLARKYLYMAALRLIAQHKDIKRWYQSKVDPKAKLKTVIALMRKLAKGMWHVAKGVEFDANKLFVLPN